jgi:hypothetical protein
LVVFHYVLAGLMALMSCIPIIHLVMGLAMVSGKIPMGSPPTGPGPPDMTWMGWIFVVVGALAILGGWTVAVLTFFAGKALSARRSWTFVFVMACVQCLWVPVGTALGVFTIIVLQRPSVKALFDAQSGRLPSPYSNA